MKLEERSPYPTGTEPSAAASADAVRELVEVPVVSVHATTASVARPATESGIAECFIDLLR
jgi:hypothetical protein